MNKQDLIEFIAKDTKLPKTACKNAVESVIKAIEQTLRKNKTVVLTGFGTFSTLKRKERMGVNPATGKPMQIPGKRVPKFKPGKRLKDLIK